MLRNLVFACVLVAVSALLGSPRDSFAQVATSEIVATPVDTSSTHTPRQQQWLKATIQDRIKLSEVLGDYGGRAYAKAQGWKPLFDGTDRTLIQGPDLVYQDAGVITHVLEDKSGGGRLGHAYGFRQGTPEWAVESAKRVLRSPKASAAEKASAEAILRAASEGKLFVHVIRTDHVLGEPVKAVL